MVDYMVIEGTLDRAMLFAEHFELIANVHVTGFTETTRNGVNVVEIRFEENFSTPSMEPSTELEYVDSDDDEWPDEYDRYDNYDWED